MEELDVPRIRLHGLRHTHASLLLQAGVSMKVITDRLGHASIATTMDLYTHMVPAMDQHAVERLDAAIHGPTAKRQQ